MKIVWELGRASVREVYEALHESPRAPAYTTVMTLMKILEEKGHLSRSKRGRAYVYTPTRSKAAVVSSLVQEFVDRVFNGATQSLLVTLVKDRKLTEEDLARISAMIEESE